MLNLLIEYFLFYYILYRQDKQNILQMSDIWHCLSVDFPFIVNVILPGHSLNTLNFNNILQLR